MGKMIGGKDKSSSKNVNNGLLTDSLSPSLGYVTQGGDAISSLLGGDSTGFDKYKAATGFDATAKQGSYGVTGNAAAGGLLRSGSTGTALQNYGQNLQNQASGSYMDRLLGLGGLGTNSAQVLASSGQTQSSKKKKGLGEILGPVAASAAAG